MGTDGELAEGLVPIPDGLLDHLHGRLVRHAGDIGALDVAYRTVDSPVGLLLLAATPRGLVRVVFEVEGHDAALEGVAAQVSPRVLRSPRGLEDVARQLDDYFAGRRRDFDLVLDMRLSRGFRREVLDQLSRIPYGSVQSYSAVAVAVGNPRAARAVGAACATNPLPLVVPCHRVVRNDGSIGQYGGGSEAKQMLLNLEASRVGQHQDPAN